MEGIAAGLCIDPVGTEKQVEDICDIISRYRLRATVFVPGKVASTDISTAERLGKFLKDDYEIANHTFSHPVRIGQLDREGQEMEIIAQHENLIRIASQSGTVPSISGFRAPFYAYEANVLGILSRLGYKWDSSSMYNPVLGIPFSPFSRDGILEIPCLFPDDATLLDRMLVEPTKLFRIFRQSFAMSEGYFVFTIHPYVSARTRNILDEFENFIRDLINQQARFLKLSEIADIIDGERKNLDVRSQG